MKVACQACSRGCLQPPMGVPTDARRPGVSSRFSKQVSESSSPEQASQAHASHPMHFCTSAGEGRERAPPGKAAVTASLMRDRQPPRYALCGTRQYNKVTHGSTAKQYMNLHKCLCGVPGATHARHSDAGWGQYRGQPAAGQCSNATHHTHAACTFPKRQVQARMSGMCCRSIRMNHQDSHKTL